MNEPPLVLLVSDNPAHVQTVREILSAGEPRLSFQHIERVRTAAARIAGGGVELVLLDMSGGRDAFMALRATVPELPLILLCEAEDDALAKQLVREGALAYISRPNWQQDLRIHVLTAILRRQGNPTNGGKPSARKGTIIAVLGAKGGVGTTTVAVNVASELTGSASVSLAELRPAFGSLCHFFRPHRATRSLGQLLEVNGPMDVRTSLWPNRNMPGLSVLFAPDDTAKHLEATSEQVTEILRQLAEVSDVVVVDLHPSLSDANRAILRVSDTLVLVVERDALCVDAAKTKVSALEAAGLIPKEAGAVIVNRVPMAAPMALADIESQVGLPTFAVVPPAADLCAAAYRVHIPLVKLDAQSSIATSLVTLAKRFSGRH